MKITRQSARHALSWLAMSALSLSPLAVSAYDAPDFSSDVFSPDGIFLPDDQKTSLLEALAAIASNFPENNRVDDDLREKALALSLRLDPLHYESRIAHRELLKGQKPKPTPYFDSLSAVSETLWTIANRLSAPPLEPEQQRLAPFLMELSLVTHPEPPDVRLKAFIVASEGKALPWNRFTTLQPSENRSTTRALFLRQEAITLQNEKKPEKRSDSEKPAPMKPVNDSPADPPVRPSTRPVPMEPISVSVASIRLVEAIEDSELMAGTISLTIRSPANGLERNWLAEQTGGASAIPLLPSEEGLPLEELAVPSALVTARAWTWPARALGEVSFTPNTRPPGPRRIISARGLLPSVILIESALKKAPINEEMIIAGGLDSATLAPLLPGGILATTEVAASMGRKYLLVPAAAMEELMAYLTKSGKLGILFTTELVSYADVAALITRATSPTDAALAGASVVFREIEAVSGPGRMTLAELARNAKVQERLQSILTTCPDHLSARAMLEFGRRPETPEMRASQFAGRIEVIVEPFLNIDDPDEDLSELKGKLEPTKLELSRLRSSVPPEAREFLTAAEDLIEAAELYLNLSNKDTAIAEQRLREANDAINLLDSQRSALGLAPATEE